MFAALFYSEKPNPLNMLAGTSAQIDFQLKYIFKRRQSQITKENSEAKPF